LNTSTLEAVSRRKPLEDPLAYLPCSSILHVKRGEAIYDRDKARAGIYMVIAGKVKVSRMTDEGRPVLIDIYQADEFFGEASLINLSPGVDSAVALETTSVMTWASEDIERLAAERPKLAIALVQLVVGRSVDFARRVESLAFDSIEHRLAHALVRFSERFGAPAENGFAEMMALTHESLSQYVATSREVITHHMNRFRSMGFLTYSRRHTSVNAAAIKDWMKQEPVALKNAA